MCPRLAGSVVVADRGGEALAQGITIAQDDKVVTAKLSFCQRMMWWE